MMVSSSKSTKSPIPGKFSTSLQVTKSFLVEFGGKEIQTGDNSSVGTELVLLHDLLVVDRVPDVDVGWEGDLPAGRVQVHHVGGHLDIKQDIIANIYTCLYCVRCTVYTPF